MDDNEKQAKAMALHEKARYLRGRFLNHVAAIERDIAIILTEYFCVPDDEKREIFFARLTDKLSLENKKSIIFELIKIDYPNYWDENRDILTALNEIQEFRNKLAHSTIDISVEALERPIEEGVSFLHWKKGDPITDLFFEEMEGKANMVLSALSDVKQLLPFKEK